MSQLEYKSVLLPYKPAVFQGDSADLGIALTKEGAERWKLSQLIMPSSVWGRTNTMVAILERARE